MQWAPVPRLGRPCLLPIAHLLLPTGTAPLPPCYPPADEFHLGTLQALLGALPQLQPGVRVHTVLSLLMDRLAK